MMRLNDRLKCIADRVEDSKTMADIGTDHGFLPIYLLENAICDSVIMADISEHSLEKARMNCPVRLKDRASFRVGDGLEVLEDNEVETVAIAGMGGMLMIEMMKKDIDHTRSFGRFIFQPRKGQAPLRKWLLENGFSIIQEDVVIENDFIPEIITAVPEAGRGYSISDLQYREEDMYDNVIYRVPPWIIEAGGPVGDFLSLNLRKYRGILDNMKKSMNRDPEKEEKVMRNIGYIEELSRRYVNER